jgi:hypothetical protein
MTVSVGIMKENRVLELYQSPVIIGGEAPEPSKRAMVVSLVVHYFMRSRRPLHFPNGSNFLNSLFEVIKKVRRDKTSLL